MLENVTFQPGSKQERYIQLLSYLEALMAGDSDEMVGALANASALIHGSGNFLWTGFYLVRPCPPRKGGDARGEELRLGPFQGPVACSRIPYGKGVCGSAWKEESTIVVEDVDKFPGHIACSSLSKSEIVVPLFYKTAEGKNKGVAGVLDIDSVEVANFDSTDKLFLERASDILSRALFTLPSPPCPRQETPADR